MIAQYQVVALVALQHLADSISAYRGLNGVLNIGDVNSVTTCLIAVYGEVQIGLANDAKETQILDARDFAHDVDDLLALLLKQLEVRSEYLDCQFALHAANRLLHVVGNRLREVPKCTRNLLNFAIHGADQFLFVLAEHRPPLLLRLQVYEVFGVRKQGRIRSVVRTADLGNHLFHFRETCEDPAGLGGYGFALCKASAGRQRASRPKRPFVQVGQELRPDLPGNNQVGHRSKQQTDGAEHNESIVNCPA